MIPAGVKAVIDRLHGADREAYTVGGCVRDLILGRKPKDWDITTNALPCEVEEIFGQGAVPTGKKNGTITVIYDGGRDGAEHEAYEVTTYRIDGEYKDNRHPSRVSFTRNLKEDLMRRDFTINAIAMDEAGNIEDPIGGVQDIEAGIIKAVGDPEDRFDEDALRIMRGIRFEAELSPLGFVIDEATENAIHDRKHLLKNISAERIRIELSKIIVSGGAEAVLRKYRDVVSVIIPEIEPSFGFDQQNPYHCYDVYEHILHTVKGIEPAGCERIPDCDHAFLTVRLAAFLHDIAKPGQFSVREGRGHFYGHEQEGAKIAEKVMRRLRYDRRTTEDVVFLISKHGTVFNPTEVYARRKLHQMGERRLRMLIALGRGDVGAQSECADGRSVRRARLAVIDDFERCVDRVISEASCFTLKDLAVDGEDLIAAGIPQGPEIGRILQDMLGKVIGGEIPNDRYTLLKNYHLL